MAMKVRYTTIAGEVMSENRNGVIRDYLPDSLGSTVGLLDNTQTITDTFEYWPYGEVRTKTGTSTTPLQFVGTYGVHTDSSSKSYTRARTVDTQKGRWLTKDPIGLDGGDTNLFRYVLNNPVNYIDPSGMQQGYPGSGTIPSGGPPNHYGSPLPYRPDPIVNPHCDLGCWSYWYMKYVRAGITPRSACLAANYVCRCVGNGCINLPPVPPLPTTGNDMNTCIPSTGDIPIQVTRESCLRYNRTCNKKCREIPDIFKRLRAACWAACMLALAGCLKRAWRDRPRH